MSALKSYFKEIFEVVQSTRQGMALTWKHAWNARKQRSVHQIQNQSYFQQSEGIVTLEYPQVEIPTPVNGRYQLHNEMDDCIVCDKCVKVCPVDCIDIEPIKATGLVGHASDGSPIRLYAAKFDIDMSKCCFCGLCTTVCPTECLTMTSEYDFSVFEVKEHNFSFANLTAEQADEKRRLYEQFVAEKAAMKEVAIPASQVASPEGDSPEAEGPASKPKPAFKPSFKKKVDSPPSQVASPEGDSPESEGPASKPKPVFKPSFKKKVASQESLVASPEGDSLESEGPAPDAQGPPSKPKPVFKPSFKRKVASPPSQVASPKGDSPESEGPAPDAQGPPSKPKPVFKPSFKRKVASPPSQVASPKGDSPESEGPASDAQSSASNVQGPPSNDQTS